LEIIDELEEPKLESAINFHRKKLLQRYFYQGFLGYYVISKLGTPETIEEPPIQPKKRQLSLSSKQGTSPSIYNKRKSASDIETKGKPLRSKTPTPCNISTSKGKPGPVKRQMTPNCGSKSQARTVNASPNQSFIRSSNKGNIKDLRNSVSVLGKTSQEILPMKRLNESFEYEFAKSTQNKKDELGAEDFIPDPIVTNIRKNGFYIGSLYNSTTYAERRTGNSSL